jgi:hypothetical protein
LQNGEAFVNVFGEIFLGKLKHLICVFCDLIEEIKNVIKSIITTKIITEVIATANSVDEAAAGSYCQS